MARQLRLTNPEAIRRSLTRVIREFDQDPDADPARFKALLHGFNTLLAFDRWVADAALSDRLDELEATINALARPANVPQTGY